LTDAPACVMHGLGHGFPAGFLIIGFHAGRTDTTLAVGGGKDAFGDDQARAGALGLIGRGQIASDAVLRCA
jgi:hypothetical protein